MKKPIDIQQIKIDARKELQEMQEMKEIKDNNYIENIDNKNKNIKEKSENKEITNKSKIDEMILEKAKKLEKKQIRKSYKEITQMNLNKKKENEKEKEKENGSEDIEYSNEFEEFETVKIKDYNNSYASQDNIKNFNNKISTNKELNSIRAIKSDSKLNKDKNNKVNDQESSYSQIFNDFELLNDNLSSNSRETSPNTKYKSKTKKLEKLDISDKLNKQGISDKNNKNDKKDKSDRLDNSNSGKSNNSNNFILVEKDREDVFTEDEWEKLIKENTLSYSNIYSKLSKSLKVGVPEHM